MMNSLVWKIYIRRLSQYCKHQIDIGQKHFEGSLDLGLRYRTELFLRRRMSSSPGTDHLQRTVHNTREEITSPASVVSIRDESSTVKCLDLKIRNPDFTFKAGQWVDTFIPGVDKVGGFSMCSSPTRLKTDGILQLAIKKSPHPPAHWVHTKCKVGDEVELRVGGDYFYDPQPGTPPHSLLLVAGGVGINPLISMMNHVSDLRHTQHTEMFCPSKVILMFSAKTRAEILFKERISELCSKKENNMSAKFFVTAEKCTEDYKCKRISEADIKKAIDNLTPGHIECYLCGPSPMIENMETNLRSCGIKDSSIHYERWW